MDLQSRSTLPRGETPDGHLQEQRTVSLDGAVCTIADTLLDAGAKMEAVDQDGNTPLLTAAGTGGAALCKLLLTRGTNADAR